MDDNERKRAIDKRIKTINFLQKFNKKRKDRK